MENVTPELKKALEDRNIDEESKEQIQQWIKDMPELEELEKLRGHYLIKRLIDSFTTKITSLEEVLRSKRSYGPTLIEAEVARLTIFETIDMYKRFINFFAVEAKLKSMKDGLENIK